MDKDDKLVGLAWRFKGIPTLEKYKAFMGSDPKLAMIFEDGHREKLPLEIIPHCQMESEDFYVFPWAIRLGDIRGWEAPEEVDQIRLSVYGKGFYWLGREAFSMPDQESTQQ